MVTAYKPRLGTRGQPEQTRGAILQAAVREFAREGVAGARTDAIARLAHVNKALLYYYFKDKEALYQAVLDDVFSGLRAAIHGALSQQLPPQERLSAYVHAHFDYIASNPLFPRIVQAEFLRAGRDPANLRRIAKQYFFPVFSEIAELLKEGAARGEFRQVNPLHFVPSMISVIVSFFNTAPVMKIMKGIDPMSPEHMAERRTAIVDFISAALFVPQRQSSHAGNQERLPHKGERS